MIPGGESGGSLGPTIWLFVICLFYLLPVIVLSKYIGAWAWLAGTGFWVIVAVIMGISSKCVNERNKHDR